MIKILLLSIALAVFGCARHHEKTSHHHHETASKNVKFEKLCAESLAEGDTHVLGKSEFSLEHGGDMYYFSSAEKKKKFEENLTENISKAEKNWNGRR